MPQPVTFETGFAFPKRHPADFQPDSIVWSGVGAIVIPLKLPIYTRQMLYLLVLPSPTLFSFSGDVVAGDPIGQVGDDK